MAAPKSSDLMPRKVVDNLDSVDSDEGEDSGKKSGSRAGDDDDEDEEDDEPETTKKPAETKHHHHVHVHPKDSRTTKKPKEGCKCDKGASRAGDLADIDTTTTQAPGGDSTSAPDIAKSADLSAGTTSTSSPDSADSTQTPPTGSSRGALKEAAKPDEEEQDSVEDYTDEGEYRTTLKPVSSRTTAPEAPSIVTVNSPPVNSTVVSTSVAPRPKNTPITIKPLTSTKKF